MSRYSRLLAVLVVAGSLWGCSSSNTIAGTWSGQDTRLDGTLYTTNLTLSQNGSTITGTLTTFNGSAEVYSGTFFGTLSGGSLTFTITVNAGEVLGEPTCALSLSGSAAYTTANGTAPKTLVGEYAGNGTVGCTDTFVDDTFSWDSTS